jgi:hypothetical protein
MSIIISEHKQKDDEFALLRKSRLKRDDMDLNLLDSSIS